MDGLDPRVSVMAACWLTSAVAQDTAPDEDGEPRVPPDGRHVVFEALRGGKRELCVADAGTDILRSGSADGAWIQCGSDRDGGPDGGREGHLRAPGGNEPRRLPEHPADERPPREGPPGTTLIASTSIRGESGIRGPWLMERGGAVGSERSPHAGQVGRASRGPAIRMLRGRRAPQGRWRGASGRL